MIEEQRLFKIIKSVLLNLVCTLGSLGGALNNPEAWASGCRWHWPEGSLGMGCFKSSQAILLYREGGHPLFSRSDLFYREGNKSQGNPGSVPVLTAREGRRQDPRAK